ncbi:hypothetical protein [Jiella endophytica]|uniref:hypothetical protein n=1 Tax=Jiella endophytica TaxID=2558362 RepID=UPI00197E15BB|nr:hypothetical protein [Jiella endophytica]
MSAVPAGVRGKGWPFAGAGRTLRVATRKARSAAFHGTRVFQYCRWQVRDVDRRPGGPHGLSKPLIVSLTSYPPRFCLLALTLKCLLSQSMRPDAVILWIAHGDRDRLTPQILKLERFGLVIRFCEDLRSYKKIVPALAEYPDSYLVTADDDAWFDRHWLKSLVSQLRSDDEVLCRRAHLVRTGRDGLPLGYDAWDFEIAAGAASPLVFPTSGGGVLYPPGVFAPEVARSDRFMALCPTADDVWLYWMMRRRGVQARRVGQGRAFYGWPAAGIPSLSHGNVGTAGGNDRQIRQMIEVYGFPGHQETDR